MIKSLADLKNVNGIVGWWRMHDEVRGKGGQRTQALAARVYKPTRCKKYSEVKAALDQWDQDLKLYEETSGACTEDTKLYSIRQIVPDELEQDIVRNAHTLKAYPEVREYVDEQVQLKRERDWSKEEQHIGQYSSLRVVRC